MKFLIIYIVSFLLLCFALSRIESNRQNKPRKFDYKDSDINERCIHYREKIMYYKRTYKC